MKRTMLYLACTVAGLSLHTHASGQVNVGGAIGNAIQQATGGAPPANTGINAGANANAGTGANTNGLGLQGSTSANVNVPGANAPSGAQLNGSVGSRVQNWANNLRSELSSAFQNTDQNNQNNLTLQGNLNSNLRNMGFQSGDQLLDANGQPLQASQLDSYLQSNPGQIRVMRNGQVVVLNTSAQAQGLNARNGLQASGNISGQANMTGHMNSHGRQKLGITMYPSSNSVVVNAVTQGSPAQAAGLRTGDQILAVNGQQVTSPNAMIQLVNQAENNKALLVQYRRNGQVMESEIALDASGVGQYQAGFADPNNAAHASADHADNHSRNTNRVNNQNSDLEARIGQLERMMQDMNSQLRQMQDAMSKDGAPTRGNRNVPDAPQPNNR